MSLVTPYAGVWIEMRNSFLTYQQGICHSLRGSVDWNKNIEPEQVTKIVTPYAGVWIEILKINEIKKKRKSLPTRECGLK